MTDKIIIDEIDVSECVCFAHYHGVANNKGMVILEIENSCVPKQKPCKDIRSCCFKKLTKRLKRKEQECEELIQRLDEIERLISEALDPEKTETEQSFDNFYKCLDIIKEAKE